MDTHRRSERHDPRHLQLALSAQLRIAGIPSADCALTGLPPAQAPNPGLASKQPRKECMRCLKLPRKFSLSLRPRRVSSGACPCGDCGTGNKSAWGVIHGQLRGGERARPGGCRRVNDEGRGHISSWTYSGPPPHRGDRADGPSRTVAAQAVPVIRSPGLGGSAGAASQPSQSVVVQSAPTRRRVRPRLQPPDPRSCERQRACRRPRTRELVPSSTTTPSARPAPAGWPRLLRGALRTAARRRRSRPASQRLLTTITGRCPPGLGPRRR
jgi:hypothetical protein